jgi:hypothetical protein
MPDEVEVVSTPNIGNRISFGDAAGFAGTASTDIGTLAGISKMASSRVESYDIRRINARLDDNTTPDHFVQKGLGMITVGESSKFKIGLDEDQVAVVVGLQRQKKFFHIDLITGQKVEFKGAVGSIDMDGKDDQPGEVTVAVEIIPLTKWKLIPAT